MVHREFKAADAIVGESGWLKVADFGLARRDDAGLADATTIASVVSAGVLLYEMATGAKPFTGKTTPEL